MAIGDVLQLLYDGRPAIDRSFKLFEAEDKSAWVIFFFTFFGVLVFDNAIIFSKPRKMSFASAVFYTIFWGSVAFAFCIFVGWWQGPHSAYMWLSGYTLQWMMSFDNLFVFHLIFKVYQTPDNMKHRPLFFGIVGQAVFTFSLLTVGEWLFHTFFFLHMFFGLFFIYIGITSVTGDDDDDDPTQNPAIQYLQAKLPFVGVYTTEGHFFVRLPVDAQGQACIPESCKVSQDSVKDLTEPTKQKESGFDPAATKCTLIDLSKIDVQGQKTELRATMLFLVVCTMEISDVIFSMDTIVAVSVQVGDLFLAFTCVAFALLTLRATFFIVEVLVQMFSMMKYAIGAILVYIGIKLIIDRWIVVPHLMDCAVLIGSFGLSILASAIYDRVAVESDSEDAPAQQLLCNAEVRSNASTTSADREAGEAY